VVYRSIPTKYLGRLSRLGPPIRQHTLNITPL